MLEDGKGFKTFALHLLRLSDVGVGTVLLLWKTSLSMFWSFTDCYTFSCISFFIRNYFSFWDFDVFFASSFSTKPGLENSTHVKGYEDFQIKVVLRPRDFILTIWLSFNSSVWSELSYFFTSRSFMVLFTAGDIYAQCFNVLQNHKLHHNFHFDTVHWKIDLAFIGGMDVNCSLFHDTI